MLFCSNVFYGGAALQLVTLDVWYAENRSLQLDVKILCLTIPTVLGRKGVDFERPDDASGPLDRHPLDGVNSLDERNP